MTSIRSKLLGWLICGFAAASAVAGIAIFHTAREEASELFDYELRTVALSMPANLETARTGEQSEPDFEGIADDRILIEIWDDAGRLVYHSRATPTLPRFPDGIRTIGHEDNHWRVFGARQPGPLRAGRAASLGARTRSRSSSRCTRSGRSRCSCRRRL